MSVDTLREMFHINRIATLELEDFLTAQTYRPEITAARNKVRSLNHVDLQSVCATPIRQGKSPKYIEGDGLACVKPKNTRDLIVDLSDCDVIDPQTESEIHKQKLEYGDVVITRSGSGTIGRASIFTGNGDFYTNDHLFIVRASEVDGFYVGAFLKSYWGERLLEAGISGSTGQLNLSNEHIKQLTLYKPDSSVQKYIGDKVRQAERLRAWAKELIAQSDERISRNFEYKLVDSMSEHPRWMPPRLVSEISLGPEFARGTEGQHTFRDAVSLSAVIDVCKCGDPIKAEERVAGRFPYYGASGPIDFHNEYNFDGTYLIVAQDGSIGCASVARGKIWANNHVWVVKVSEQYDVDTVGRYLNTHFPYWKGITTGSVVPKVTAESLLRLKIPLEVAKDKEAGDLLRASVLASSAARHLTAAARFLVESLIEGQFTEQQLSNAQKAIEAGDTSLDREILARLTTKGLDGDGDPLFPDLDQLYELLAQSQSLNE